MDAGIALIPRNRAAHGALPEFSLVENLTLLTLARYYRFGWLRSSAARKRTTELAEDFDIRPGLPDMQFRFISGGNQQKAVLAKWWERSPKIILLDEPTQGIDVGARAKIYQLVLAAAHDGAAVLVSSVEYDELAKICSRVLVYVNGVPHVELIGDQVTPEAIAQACYEEDPGNAG
jgi:ribose transport system ATP-binding protein